MNPPLFSIVIPVYNTADYLPRCLSSIVDQVGECDYEVIVVNDGSTDNSLEVIEGYLQVIPTMQVYTIPHATLSHVCRMAWPKCVGEYIIRLDSDDWLSQDFLENLRTSVVNSPDIVYITALGYQSKTNTFEVLYRPDFDYTLASHSFLMHLFSPRPDPRDPLWFRVVKREVYADYEDTFKLQCGNRDDSFAMLKTVLRAKSFIGSSAVYNYTLSRVNSVTYNMPFSFYIDGMYCYIYIYQWLQAESDPIIKFHLRRYLDYSLYSHLSHFRGYMDNEQIIASAYLRRLVPCLLSSKKLVSKIIGIMFMVLGVEYTYNILVPINSLKRRTFKEG